jgi:signal transduction histidine kinase
MKETLAGSIGRAFSYCCEKRDISAQKLLSRVAWELSHSLHSEFEAIAFVVSDATGTCVVAKPKESTILPQEILRGFLLEQDREPLSCRVRDHALDSLRFLGRQLRTSITVRIQHGHVLERVSECIVWFGISGVATPKKVELAQEVARSVSEWLEVYAGAVASFRKSLVEIESLNALKQEMTTVAHDVRAPLSMLQYLVADMMAEDSAYQSDRMHIVQELQYVDRLLEGLSPRMQSKRQQSDTTSFSTDICSVLASVVERFKPEATMRQIAIEVSALQSRECRVDISELALERVLSNIVGNAVRYGAKNIKLDVKVQEKLWGNIEVRDDGAGFPAEVLEKVARGAQTAQGRTGRGGWGVGLLSSVKLIEKFGGTVAVSNDVEGAMVSVALRLSEECCAKYDREDPTLRVTKGLMNSKEARERDEAMTTRQLRVGGGAPSDSLDVCSEVVIVDDDEEHAASLERILAKRGAGVRVFTNVSSAVEYLNSVQKSRLVRVLCDVHMPDGGADRLLRCIKGSSGAFMCAVMSGEAPDEELYQFAALGAREFFSKPIDIDGLIAWLG